MRTQPSIACSIRERGTDYVLAVKNNQPLLTEPIYDFFTLFIEHTEKTPQAFAKNCEKYHRRIELLVVMLSMCRNVFTNLNAGRRTRVLLLLKASGSSGERQAVNSLLYHQVDWKCREIAEVVRAHWHAEDKLHWWIDVTFAWADDQMRAHTGYATHNQAVLKQLTMNLIRQEPVKRRGGIKARGLISATSIDNFMSTLMGLRWFHAIVLRNSKSGEVHIWNMYGCMLQDWNRVCKKIPLSAGVGRGKSKEICCAFRHWWNIYSMISTFDN